MKTKSFLNALAFLGVCMVRLFAAPDFNPPNFPKPVFPDRTFDVRDFGAKGDGVANDTGAFNKAISACNGAGGGTVLVPAGKFQAAGIVAQNNVRIQLDAAATIVGGPGGAFLAPEPNENDAYQDYGHSHFRNGLFWGDRIENFAVVGGTIDAGVIITQIPETGGGDKIFSITRGKNLQFEGTTFTKGAHFVYLLNDCENVTIANNVVKTSRDVIDIMGCRNVQIYGNRFTGCTDDCVGIKSDWALGRRITTRNIYVWNCYFETKCNGIQFGSETAGDFYNINCWDIEVGHTEKAAIGITSNDSAIIDGAHFKNFKVREATAPIFMMITNRLRTGEKLTNPKLTPGVIRNITISGVTITDCMPQKHSALFPPVISGLPGYPIENITIENVKLNMPGNGTKKEAALKNAPYAKSYSPRELVASPAAGFFIRHAKNVTLRNFEITYDKADARVPLVFIDVDGLVLENFNTQKTAAPERMRLENVRNLAVRNSPGLQP